MFAGYENFFARKFAILLQCLGVLSIFGCTSLAKVTDIDVLNIEPAIIHHGEGRQSGGEGLLVLLKGSDIRDVLISRTPQTQHYWFDQSNNFNDRGEYGNWSSVFGNVVCIVENRIYELNNASSENVVNVCGPLSEYAIILESPYEKANGYDSFEEMLQQVDSEGLMLFGLWPSMLKVPVKLKSNASIGPMLMSAIESPEMKVIIVYESGYSSIRQGIIEYQ